MSVRGIVRYGDLVMVEELRPHPRLQNLEQAEGRMREAGLDE